MDDRGLRWKGNLLLPAVLRSVARYSRGQRPRIRDLNAIVASVYKRGGYDARIDYRAPVPPPALAEDETAWVDALLAPIRSA